MLLELFRLNDEMGENDMHFVENEVIYLLDKIDDIDYFVEDCFTSGTNLLDIACISDLSKVINYLLVNVTDIFIYDERNKNSLVPDEIPQNSFDTALEYCSLETMSTM